MLSHSPVPLWPRCTCRRLLVALGELMVLVLFVSGVGLSAPGPVQKDETKKTETKKDKLGKEEPKQEELKKEQPGKDEKKKSDADKEIDDLVKEMTRNAPLADPAMIRQTVRNMSPEQRKKRLAMMKNRPQPGVFPGQPVGGVAMPLGFVRPGHNARLGVMVDPPSAALAEQLDLPRGQGLVVREVLPDTTAAKAGLKPHDLLLEFDGKAVPDRIEEFARQMGAIKADTAVEMVVLRKGKKETIKDVKLPEIKALQPGFAPGGFSGVGRPQGGFPQPPAGLQPPSFPPQGGIANSPAVTTLVRTQDHFNLQHQEGGVIITLTGQTADGKTKMNPIHIRDGLKSEQYDSVDKVPEKYRKKVKSLLEISEKGNVKTESKSAP